jgi:hypothetical protein
VTVYRVSYGEEFEWLLPVRKEDYDLFRFDRTARAASWKPVQMERLKVSDRGRRLKPADLIGGATDTIMFLGRRAKERIGSYLERYGELLPLACDDGEFWVLNVTSVADALDEQASQGVLRSSEDGKILMIRRPAFRASRLVHEVFRLPDPLPSPIYVTTLGMERLRASGLTGLDFVSVWAPN